ncbi:MAG: DUF4920 domain-containing protein [Woeseiaceae bacterium]|nr:DUF4920 domain-containing protein [Woeseiaceae bacterium]
MTPRMHLAAIVLPALLVNSTGLAEDRGQVLRLSEPVEKTAEYETFGEPTDFSVDRVTLEEVVSDSDRYVGRTVRVETRVSKVCRKKGCFFIARAGSEVVRVSFRDYGFFVPTDISGKRVMLVGEVEVGDLTPDEARHLADDLGEAEETIESGEEFGIVASSVRVLLDP